MSARRADELHTILGPGRVYCSALSTRRRQRLVFFTVYLTSVEEEICVTEAPAPAAFFQSLIVLSKAGKSVVLVVHVLKPSTQ